MKPATQTQVFYFLLLLAGSAVLYRVAPEGTKSGMWTHNVLRNWEEFGIQRLGGQLVYNPGGIDAIERPAIYAGHRPTSFYLSYAVGKLTGGAGNNGLYFYLLLALAVGWSLWRALAPQPFAWWFAGVIVFCPGYLRTTLVLDPLTVPVLLGFPTVLLVEKVLRAKTIPAAGLMVLIAVMSLYAALNWTSCFALAIAAGYFAVALKQQRRRLLLFVLLAAAGVGLVAVVSLSSKMGGHNAAASAGGFRQFYDSYLFGPGGYRGYPMTWPKAIVRLVVANLIGLLPLWLAFAWLHFRLCVRHHSFPWPSLLPFAIAVLSVAFMRNYFAHHPWMSCPVVMSGLVFSTYLLLDDNASATAASLPGGDQARSWRGLAIVGASFLYGLLIALILRVNSIEEDSLRHFIQSETNRRDIILVNSRTDPVLATNTDRFSQLFDRRVVVDSDPDAAIRSSLIGSQQILRLASKPPVDGAKETAHLLIADTFFQKIATRCLSWYRRVVARRDKGDRLELDSTYYLSETKSRESLK